MELPEKYAVVAFAGQKSHRRTKSRNSLSPTFTSGRALTAKKPSLRRSAFQRHSRRRVQSVFDLMALVGALQLEPLAVMPVPNDRSLFDEGIIDAFVAERRQTRPAEGLLIAPNIGWCRNVDGSGKSNAARSDNLQIRFVRSWGQLRDRVDLAVPEHQNRRRQILRT